MTSSACKVTVSVFNLSSFAVFSRSLRKPLDRNQLSSDVTVNLLHQIGKRCKNLINIFSKVSVKVLYKMVVLPLFHCAINVKSKKVKTHCFNSK